MSRSHTLAAFRVPPSWLAKAGLDHYLATRAHPLEWGSGAKESRWAQVVSATPCLAPICGDEIITTIIIIIIVCLAWRLATGDWRLAQSGAKRADSRRQWIRRSDVAVPLISRPTLARGVGAAPLG